MAKLVTFLGMHLRLPAEKDCGLTNRSTGHFAAVRAWLSFHFQPNTAHRKVPVSFNVRRHKLRRRGVSKFPQVKYARALPFLEVARLLAKYKSAIHTVESNIKMYSFSCCLNTNWMSAQKLVLGIV